MGKVVEGGRIEVRDLAESQVRDMKPRSSKSQRRISIGLLFITDVIMFCVGAVAARWLSHSAFHLPSGQFFGASWAALSEMLVAYLAVYWAYGLYNSGILSAGGSDYRAVGNANAVALVAAILIAGLETNWSLDARTIVDRKSTRL